MARTIAAGAGLALALTVTTPSLGHHSRANFDLDTFVDREGVVTEFSWRNPHAYFVIESVNEAGETEELTYEMNATPILRRYGWEPDSLAVGDHVRVRANPDRNPDKLFFYTAVIVKEDGSELWSWDGGGRISPPEPTEGSADFAGVWRFRPLRGFDPLAANRPDDELRNELPVTDAGQAMLDAFDPEADPTLNCLPYSVPGIVGAPYPFEIIRESDEIVRLRYELENEERVVHLGATRHPDDLEPSHMGHSIGWFGEQMFVIDTVGFEAIRWGLGQGLDSSTEKHVVEVYTLTSEGTVLQAVVTTEDPVYLSEPVQSAHRFVLHQGYELSTDYECDVETARRHLTAGD